MAPLVELFPALGDKELAGGHLPLLLVALGVVSLCFAAALGGSSGFDFVDRASSALFLRGGNDPKQIEREAKALAKRGDFSRAAELFLDINRKDQAVIYFRRAGDLQRAARVLKSKGRFVQAAELFLEANDGVSAAEAFAAGKEHERAATCYAELGRISSAGEQWQRAGEPRRAAECFREGGYRREAAQAYTACEEWLSAAQCLESVIIEEFSGAQRGHDAGVSRQLEKLVLQCAKLYQRAGERERAQRVFERGGRFAEAGELALACGDYAHAAELFVKTGDVQRAGAALEQGGASEEAALLLGNYYRDRDDLERAAAYFEQAGEHLSAADAYRASDQLQEAARAYERGGELDQAAELWRSLNELSKAATLYERAGNWGEAAACLGEEGDVYRQAEVLEKAGQFLAAGHLYLREGKLDDAVRALQTVDGAQEDPLEAAALLGTVFVQRGRFDLCIAKLRQTLEGRELDRSTAHPYYVLARAYEGCGEFVQAKDLYERILTTDYQFQDCDARLEAVSAALATPQRTPDAPRTAAAARPPEAVAPRSPQAVPAKAPPPAGPAPSAAAPREPRAAEGRSPAGPRYRILRELGRDRMGTIYKANDEALERPVVYKVLSDAVVGDAHVLASLLRASKAMAQLHHPHIASLYGVGKQDRDHYLAMEFVDGISLKEIVDRRGAIAPGGVLHVLVQMCDALAYAHELGVLHGDLQTTKVIWTRGRQIKIADFGLASGLTEADENAVPVAGEPHYLSPELILGHEVDHRADLYSAGVVLFELATGKLPFAQGNIAYHHVHTPPRPPREHNPKLPAFLEAIILRCLSKRPEQRYASAQELLQEIRTLQARAGSTRSEGGARSG